MAEGLNIEQISNRITTSNGSALIYAAQPGGSSYVDSSIELDDLLSDRDADIESNSDAIAILETEIAELQANFTFTKRASDNAAFQIQQDENSYLFMIGFRNIGSSPTVSVGTTEGGDDIVSSREITDSTRILITGNYELSDNTLYFTVTGGSVATTIIYMKDFFNV